MLQRRSLRRERLRRDRTGICRTRGRRRRRPRLWPSSRPPAPPWPSGCVSSCPGNKSRDFDQKASWVGTMVSVLAYGPSIPGFLSEEKKLSMLPR